ncbi:putative phage tail protein [Paenibacillus lautus]|uniref:putative phage tail protein n=1 Tax=Paenibacillus lautus TaxID=1401 RepID=UPI001C7D765D|nr:putative phage tail protein [Paenibacillus lautus]MBX4149499.1 YmfQ family protein [Paenibacillus lautus]
MFKDKLNRNLHKIVRKDPLTNEINGSIGLSLDNFEVELNSLLAQLNIDTATWALSIYEKELGIRTDLNKPLDERRSVIKSKIRGTGKIGAAQIKIVADAYSNGNVEVTLEHGIRIEFTSTYGIPPNVDDLKRMVREIAPAHLSINYVFRFYMYGEMTATGMTYGQIKATGLTYKEIKNKGLM